MDLINAYIQRRNLVKAALDRYYMKCKNCNGIGIVSLGEEELRQLQNYWSFPTFICCPVCDGEIYIHMTESEATKEEIEWAVQLYIKHKNRKERHAKNQKTKKPWLQKSNYNDPRFG